MIKKVKEEKTITVEENKLFCDLCEEVIKEGKAFVSLRPSKATESGSKWTHSESIEVCSPECLTENAHVIGLLLNTKHFPEMESAHKKAKASTSGSGGYITSGAYTIPISSGTGYVTVTGTGYLTSASSGTYWTSTA